jgi:hypothetical protein
MDYQKASDAVRLAKEAVRQAEKNLAEARKVLAAAKRITDRREPGTGTTRGFTGR